MWVKPTEAVATFLAESISGNRLGTYDIVKVPVYPTPNTSSTVYPQQIMLPLTSKLHAPCCDVSTDKAKPPKSWVKVKVNSSGKFPIPS